MEKLVIDLLLKRGLATPLILANPRNVEKQVVSLTEI
jgi:hypothetical protein